MQYNNNTTVRYDTVKTDSQIYNQYQNQNNKMRPDYSLLYHTFHHIVVGVDEISIKNIYIQIYIYKSIINLLARSSTVSLDQLKLF